MGALENQAEQTWTSHQVTLLNEMNCVASDALEKKRRNLLKEATTELERHQRQRHEHLQDYQQSVRRHVSEVQHKDQVQQVARKEEVEILRHELAQSLAEASENRSEIKQLRQKHDSLTTHCRSFENGNTEMSKCSRFL